MIGISWCFTNTMFHSHLSSWDACFVSQFVFCASISGWLEFYLESARFRGSQIYEKAYLFMSFRDSGIYILQEAMTNVQSPPKSSDLV